MLCLLDLTQGGVDPRNFRRGPEIVRAFSVEPRIYFESGLSTTLNS
jgi:hypothetical protein